jgi:hypothetical protein
MRQHRRARPLITEQIQTMKTQNTIESKEMPAFRVHLDDGTSYVTSMAHGVTLADARAYFVGSVQTEENEETGAETRRIVLSVETL